MPTLNDLRDEIDKIDGALFGLFTYRMHLSAEIARVKAMLGQPIFDQEREAFLMEAAAARVPPELAEEARLLQACLGQLSRAYQRRETGLPGHCEPAN
ncbi:MAG: chorismate mutase [Oscillospiraceae bacterium]|jgi:chorismate mutase|nr:chorismate mutase [Oscillospiraceae bacterium]